MHAKNHVCSLSSVAFLPCIISYLPYKWLILHLIVEYQSHHCLHISSPLTSFEFPTTSAFFMQKKPKMYNTICLLGKNMGLCLDIYSRSQEGKVVDLWSLGKIVWNTNVFLINELFDYSIPPGKPNGRPKFWRSACSNKFIIRVFLSSATGSFSLQSLKSSIRLTRSLIDWEVDSIVLILVNRH